MSKSNMAASTTITMKKKILFRLQRKLDQDDGASEQKRRKEDKMKSDTKVCSKAFLLNAYINNYFI